MNEGLQLVADAPVWYETAATWLVTIIGVSRIPMKILSGIFQDAMKERIAVLVLRKEDTSTLLARIASPWYIYGSMFLDTIFSIKLPKYTDVLALIEEKKKGLSV